MACCLDGGIAPPCFTLRSRAAFDVSFDGASTYLLDIASARISMNVEDGSRGNVVAASASNHVVKIYDRSTLCFQGYLTGHEGQITALQFAAENPNILWTASQDATLRCWDVRLPQGANQTSVIPSKHSIPFCSLALSPAGVTMAAGTAVEEEDAHIILWDLRSCQEIARFTECHSDDITQLAFNETAPRTLVSGSMDGLLCVFDTLNLTESESLVAVLNAEASVAQLGFFGPSHEFVYALSHCETFGLWHSTEGTQYARLLNVRERIKELYGSPVDYFITCSYHAGSGRLFVLGGDHEGNLTILNAGTEGFAPLVVVAGGHSATIRCAHWDHEAGSLLTGSEDGFLCHWLAPDTDSSSDSSLSSDTGKVHCRSRQPKYSPY